MMISEIINSAAKRVWHIVGPGKYSTVYVKSLITVLSQYSGTKNTITIGKTELTLDFGTDSDEHVIIDVRADPTCSYVDINRAREMNIGLYTRKTNGYFINFGADKPVIATYALEP